LELEIGVNVVGSLGEDAGPIDGVDCTEVLGFVDFWVGEESFDNILNGQLNSGTWRYM
jgi:hypothetical protein